MFASGLHYFPLAWPFLLLLAGLLAVAAAVVAVKILDFTSASMGLGPRTMLSVLLLALLRRLLGR